MPVRKNALLVGLVLGILSAPAVRALDKEGKKWLDEVKPIMLPDEEKTYRGLKDKNDVAEFQKIFWTRRDPDLETPANEYQAEYQKAKTDADARFRIGGTPGSQTDCGRVYIILGPPDEMKKEEPTDSPIPGRRAPETWTYRDRPTLKFGPTGQIQLGFDETCTLPQGNRMGEQLNRLVEGKIANPNLGYRTGADGKIVKLVEQLPKPSPTNALLKAPRQDFPVSAEPVMFLRSQDGASYVAGLVKGDASGLTVHDAGGKKTAKLVVGMQAIDETGKAAGTSERETTVDVAPDGSYVASYGMAMKPGTYTMRVAVLDPQTGKGSVATVPLKMPDYNAEGLSLSPLIVLRDVQETSANPQDALSAFQLGPMRFVPHYGNVFTPADSITLLTFLYNPKVDEATGKPSTTASFTILKDGKPLAKAEDQNFDTLGAGPSVGPVSLTKFTPGKYVAQVKVRDNVAKKDLAEEVTFEVK
jgi:GWxTD domain-containing protein